MAFLKSLHATRRAACLRSAAWHLRSTGCYETRILAHLSLQARISILIGAQNRQVGIASPLERTSSTYSPVCGVGPNPRNSAYSRIRWLRR